MMKKIIEKLQNWFNSIKLTETEVYLSSASDLADLERRIRQLETRKYYY